VNVLLAPNDAAAVQSFGHTPGENDGVAVNVCVLYPDGTQFGFIDGYTL
jgi:hypothetical protein